MKKGTYISPNAQRVPLLRTNQVFTLNNDTAVDIPRNPTHCILRNLQIFNYPLNDAEVEEIYRKLRQNLLE